MDEWNIQTHDFQTSKNQIKEFADKTPSTLELDKFKTSEGLFGWFNHNVTGAELNIFVSTLQEYLRDFNDRNKDFINEFGQVYQAFESLDRDYIQGILFAVKSTEKTQKELDQTVDRLKQTVMALKSFRDEIRSYSHLRDIDITWADVKRLEIISKDFSSEIKRFDSVILTITKDISVLKQFQESVNQIKHFSDLDDVWSDVEKIKTDLEICLNGQKEFSIQLTNMIADADSWKAFQSKLKSLKHLDDIDSEWDFSHSLESRIVHVESETDKNHADLDDMNTRLTNVLDRLDLENQKLTKKIKYAYIIAGCSIIIAFTDIILHIY